MMMEATLSARDAGSKPVIRSARRLERRSMMLWLLPPVAWFTVFMLLPYALLFYYSLGHSQDMRFVPGFSFHNFVRVFTDEPYLGVILKSARIGLMTSILSALVAYPLAFALAFHVRSAAVKFALYLLVIVPWWASYLVKAYAWKTILGTGGILNATLQGLGVTDEPVRLVPLQRVQRAADPDLHLHAFRGAVDLRPARTGADLADRGGAQSGRRRLGDLLPHRAAHLGARHHRRRRHHLLAGLRRLRRAGARRRGRFGDDLQHRHQPARRGVRLADGRRHRAHHHHVGLGLISLTGWLEEKTQVRL